MHSRSAFLTLQHVHYCMILELWWDFHLSNPLFFLFFIIFFVSSAFLYYLNNTTSFFECKIKRFSQNFFDYYYILVFLFISCKIVFQFTKLQELTGWNFEENLSLYKTIPIHKILIVFCKEKRPCVCLVFFFFIY